MTKLMTKDETVKVKNIILDIIDYFNSNYAKNGVVTSEFDMNALLNNILFNMEENKEFKVDTYDFYNVNSYVVFNGNTYDYPVDDTKLLGLLNKLYMYMGSRYLANSFNYQLSNKFVLKNDNIFYPNRVTSNYGNLEIYGTQNNELLRTIISIKRNNQINIEGEGTKLFVGNEEEVPFSDYSLNYLKQFFNLIDAEIKDIDYKPFYPVVTLSKKGS